MKVTLKLGEEKNGLKFIQVNDGFVVVDFSKEININEYTINEDVKGKWGFNKTHNSFGIINYVNEHGLGLGDFVETTQTGDSIYDSITINGYKVYNILFATPNLNLEDVLVIKNNEFFTFNKQQLRFLFDTSLHAKIGGLNQDEEFERVLIFLNKQVQQNLFTEEQVREAFNAARRFRMKNVFEYDHADEFIQSLKQPQLKIEITFEGSKAVKCVML